MTSHHWSDMVWCDVVCGDEMRRDKTEQRSTTKAAERKMMTVCSGRSGIVSSVQCIVRVLWCGMVLSCRLILHSGARLRCALAQAMVSSRRRCAVWHDVVSYVSVVRHQRCYAEMTRSGDYYTRSEETQWETTMSRPGYS